MPSKGDAPGEVQAILAALEDALNSIDPEEERRIGDAKHGIYAFYDYDMEPIYVGQTYEKLRVRIRRHLTNQRTDAVAMNVLDVFEVCWLEMWPYWRLEGKSNTAFKPILEAAEYTVFQKLIERSRFGAILNEKPVKATGMIDLPPSYRFQIVTGNVYERRKHPDLRIARRAATIAKLAQVISERSVQNSLRDTLLTQARRLEELTRRRLEEVKG